MKVLVVGGAGFIGHNVVQKFKSEGHTVAFLDSLTGYESYEHILHHNKIQHRMGLMKGCKLYHGDIATNPLLVDSAFNELRPDIVVNCAAVPITSIAESKPMMASDTMITGLLRLLKLSYLFEVKRFIQISSSMVYGDFVEEPIREDAPCHPLDVYGILKLTGEKLVRSYTYKHGLEHTIIRPSAVYGPTGNEPQVITKILRATRAGAKDIEIRGKDTALDFTYVSDLAEGIYLAAIQDNAIGETFNITAGEARKLVDVTRWFEHRYGDWDFHVTEADPFQPKRGALSIQKAEDLLGYKPMIGLEQGLALYDSHTSMYDL